MKETPTICIVACNGSVGANGGRGLSNMEVNVKRFKHNNNELTVQCQDAVKDQHWEQTTGLTVYS
ncbi:MAG TPA: hypothetical protein VGO47_09930 [Chlamydiales bacterium]|nr:hypothetical protein [Chlamydiales bacterium]